VTSPVNKQDSGAIGFGIIGAGNIAQFHAQAVAGISGARVVGFVAQTLGRAQTLAQKYGADAFTDLDHLLARPDVHVINICTPSGTHADIGIRAARAGKHVICEKPIDVTLTKARALVDACREKGVRLGVIFQSRFLPAVALIKKAVDRGRLGRLIMGDAYVKWWRNQAYYEAARWRGTKALDGGGALMNQSIHTIDLLQYTMGPVSSIFGFAEKKRHPYIESEDTAAAVVRFKNGAIGTITGTTSLYPGFARRLEIHGEKGSIILDGNDITVWKLEDTGEEEVELERMRALAKDASDGSSDPMALDVAGHRRQIEDFIGAVRDGRAPIVDGAEGLKALEIVLAVYRSSETGRLVELPL
jgi:predicted dehydrogenase